MLPVGAPGLCHSCPDAWRYTGPVSEVRSFHLNERGLQRVLGGLEAAVMEVLWEHGPLTIVEVQNALLPQRLAFNTVMTVLTRLASKGLVTRRQGRGRRSLYEAALSREAFVERLTRDVTVGLVRDFGDYAVAQFVAALEREDPGRIAELEALLRRKREGR